MYMQVLKLLPKKEKKNKTTLHDKSMVIMLATTAKTYWILLFTLFPFPSLELLLMTWFSSLKPS